MKNSGSRLALGAASLLAAQSPLMASQAFANSTSEQNIETLNAASLKSIESTWLEVPASCKAREFHADAISQNEKVARQSIQAVYASYEA